MKKLSAILLLCCLCFTLSGYHFIFRFQIAKAKAEMKAFLFNQKKHKDIVELRFSKEAVEQLEWEEEHEFRFKGEMYDVIEKHTEGGFEIIRCISDTKETALLQQYQKALQKTNNPDRQTSSLVKLITSNFMLPSGNLIKQPEKIVKSNFYTYASAVVAQPVTKVTPPPKAC